MTPDEAVSWLRQVEGQLFRGARERDGAETWVAVVRAPGAGVQRGRLIVALGGTPQEATAAAEGQWQSVWRSLSQTH